MSAAASRESTEQWPRLYRDLADGYPLVTPVAGQTFEPGTATGGSEAGGRGLRYLQWRWVPDSGDETYVTDMAYLLRDESGGFEVIHDRHVTGLFPRGVWLQLVAGAGFAPLAVPFEHGSDHDGGREVFLGRRPARATGA